MQKNSNTFYEKKIYEKGFVKKDFCVGHFETLLHLLYERRNEGAPVSQSIASTKEGIVVKKMNDEILIQKAKMKNPDAFTKLMKSQMQSMYRTAKAILMNDEDVSDAIQDTLLICWEKLDELRENRYFKTWMTKILVNNCYGIIRRNKRITYTDELPESVCEEKVSNIEWREALSSIDEKYRIVLILFYSEGFHTKEIAKILGITDSTVRTRLSRGREQLAEYYHAL